jgi:hypothetical protein
VLRHYNIFVNNDFSLPDCVRREGKAVGNAGNEEKEE